MFGNQEMFWRTVFWSGMAIIVVFMIQELRSSMRLFNPQKIVRILVKWSGIAVLFTFLCLLFSPHALMTYGQAWWVRGQLVDRDTRHPVKGALIVFTCSQPELKYMTDLIDERFKYLEASINAEGKTSQTLVYGISDQEGRFVAKASFISGTVPFGYPLWGSLKGKHAWMIIRKEGYQPSTTRLITWDWKPSIELSAPPLAGYVNEIGIFLYGPAISFVEPLQGSGMRGC